jgi:PhnB protein
MAKKKVKTKTAKKSKQKTTKRTVRAKSKRATKAKVSHRPARTTRASAPAPAAQKIKGIAPGYNWVNPFLIVRDMERAIDFYKNAFGFQIRNTMPGPDGKLMHAELVHNDSVVMFGPERLDQGISAPQGVSPVTIYAYVENVDDFASRASTNGGRLIEPPSDRFWGDRCCLIMDTEGHFWMIATHVREVPPEEMHP